MVGRSSGSVFCCLCRRRTLPIVLYVVVALFACVKLYEHVSVSLASLSAAGHPEQSRLTEAFLTVVILSGPQERAARDVVRATWVRIQPGAFYRFFVGSHALQPDLVRALNDEALLFGDMVLLRDVNDSYASLTDKVLASFVWNVENVDFRYLLKVDTDSFVQLHRFYSALADVHARRSLRRRHHDLLYWGYMKGGGTVRKHGKWSDVDGDGGQRESRWFLSDRYLPYAYGGGYVLSRPLAQVLASNAPLLRRYRNEDVSVGAWLAGLDVQYVHDTRFDTGWRSRGCLNAFLVTHKQTAAAMRRKFERISNGTGMCAVEVEHFPAYEYVWKHPASECCRRRAAPDKQFFS